MGEVLDHAGTPAHPEVLLRVQRKKTNAKCVTLLEDCYIMHMVDPVA